jgi:hypothetical protein
MASGAKMAERIKKKYDRFRRRYTEMHSKVVDLSTHDRVVRPKRWQYNLSEGRRRDAILCCVNDLDLCVMN